MQLHRNEWWVREARKELQKRGGDEAIRQGLRKILDGNPDVTRKLRALWALHAIGGDDESLLTKLLAHDEEYVRGCLIVRSEWRMRAISAQSLRDCH